MRSSWALISWSAAVSRRAFSVSSSVTTVFPAPLVNQAVFLPQGTDLSSLITHPALRTAVGTTGLEKASNIQNLSYGPISKGKDVILGAETGSGKTLAYFLPIIDRHLQYPPENRKFGVVLAPNAPLCDQIISMTAPIVQSLRDSDYHIKLTRWAESLSEPSPADQLLSIVVCTPKVLADSIRGIHPQEAHHPLRSLSFIVMDEADMLLDGAYLHQVERVLEAIKLVRRAQIGEGVLKPHESMVQFVLSAATMPTIGAKSIDQYARRAFPKAIVVQSDYMHRHHPAIHQEFIKLEAVEPCGPTHAEAVLEHLERLHSLNAEPASHTCSSSTDRLAWLRGLDYSVMIFLNTAADAAAFASSLRELGVDCVEMHSSITKREREENLQRFRLNEVRVAVCTDSVARGVDLPQVRRVVQADFALNVVQHLHRIGRASRAGRAGASLNFYFPRSEDLVKSVIGTTKMNYIPAALEVEEDGGAMGVIEGARRVPSSIEQSFSRRRGFRQRRKRAQRAASESSPPA